MAAEKVFKARYAKHPTAEIDGVTHFGITAGTTKVVDPGGAGNPGVAETQVTDRQLQVTLYGTNLVALLALVGAAAANCVLGFQGSAQANEMFTAKNVLFDEVVGEFTAPTKDSGGKIPTCAIRGTAQWGASDTFALMLVGAAGT